MSLNDGKIANVYENFENSESEFKCWCEVAKINVGAVNSKSLVENFGNFTYIFSLNFPKRI